jgi:hypothetical protein
VTPGHDLIEIQKIIFTLCRPYGGKSKVHTVVGARCWIVCGLDRRGGTAAGSLMGKCKSAKTDCKSKIRNKYERARRSLAKTVERNGFRKFSYSQSYFTFSIRFLLVFVDFFIWVNSKRIPLRSGLLMN